VEKAAQEKAKKAQQKSERKKERQIAARGAVKTKRKGLKLKKGFRVKVSQGGLQTAGTSPNADDAKLVHVEDLDSYAEEGAQSLVLSAVPLLCQLYIMHISVSSC
jgi:hypothetical protein